MDLVPSRTYESSIKWYKLAAEQGNIEPQNNLGFMSLDGKSVTRNLIHAFMWLDIAASNVDKKMVENRSITEKQMASVDIAKAQELALECAAKNYKEC